MDKIECEVFFKTSSRRDEIEIDATKGKRLDNKDQDEAIRYSVNIIKALEEKVKEHNSSHKRKVNIYQLKKVFCSATRDKVENKNRGLWALGRVNMFIRMVEGKLSRLSDNIENFKRVPYNRFVEITANWTPSQEDLDSAEKIVDKYNLHYSFSSIDELYIEYQPTAIDF